MQIETVGEGFLFPEGPIALPDDSLILVDIFRGALMRLWGGGRSEVIAELGGGPNGAAFGPDGAVYVCNNGGLTWRRDESGRPVYIGAIPVDYDGGRIERVDLVTGRHERVHSRCGDTPLRGPNDLVFDRTGGFWFTDSGKSDGHRRDHSALYYARPDGSEITCAAAGALSFNGVGLSPDERTLYVADTLSARLWAYALSAPGVIARPEGRLNPARLLATVPGDVWLDSLAVTDSGAVCVGVLLEGAIATVRADGGARLAPMPEPFPTNICFGGAGRQTAYVTLSTTGQVVRAPWPEPGLALNFNPY